MIVVNFTEDLQPCNTLVSIWLVRLDPLCKEDRELLDLVSCWTSSVLQDDVLQGRGDFCFEMSSFSFS